MDDAKKRKRPVETGRCDKVAPKSRVGTPNVCTGTYRITNHANTAGDKQEIVSIRLAGTKRPDIHGGSTKSCTDEADGLKSCSGVLSMPTHAWRCERLENA